MPTSPIPPRIPKDCDPGAAARILGFYDMAYRYARAADVFLDRLAATEEASREKHWNAARPVTAAKFFGPYSADSFEVVTAVIRGVLTRFEKGYDGVGGVRFLCLAANQERCDQGVLANAREFGAIRVCPRLIGKDREQGGVVILHEFLHQRLGVEDVRSQTCRNRDETRCYRGGARRLVEAGLYSDALRNNDNYAYFARAAFVALRNGRDKE